MPVKSFLVILVLGASTLVQAYAHDGLYKSLARPATERCEARAERAGVSRPNEQLIINMCLHDRLVEITREIIREYPDYANSSGHNAEDGTREARRDATRVLRMYENEVLTDLETGARLTGSDAQKRLEIELGRRIDQMHIMQNQPALMNNED